MTTITIPKRVGVLGTGTAGRAMGDAFVELGCEVALGTRELWNEKAMAWKVNAGKRGSVGTFGEAAAFGEIVVLAIRGDVTEGVLRSVGHGPFGEKVVIDLTNPIDRDQHATPTLFVGTTDSLGERVQKLLPDARVIKAFNTVDASHFFRPQIPGGPPDMLLAGNDFNARDVVAAVCREFGWGTAYLGSIECARFLEPMALAWAAYAVMTGGTGHAFKLLGKPAKPVIPLE
jgi:predicted dinucleotide-binding enzyme